MNEKFQIYTILKFYTADIIQNIIPFIYEERCLKNIFVVEPNIKIKSNLGSFMYMYIEYSDFFKTSHVYYLKHGKRYA